MNVIKSIAITAILFGFATNSFASIKNQDAAKNHPSEYDPYFNSTNQTVIAKQGVCSVINGHCDDTDTTTSCANPYINYKLDYQAILNKAAWSFEYVHSTPPHKDYQKGENACRDIAKKLKNNQNKNILLSDISEKDRETCAYPDGYKFTMSAGDCKLARSVK